MDNFNLGISTPVRNLQTFLRKISFYYETVPRVVPDGIFGEQTKTSVIGFQATFNLPQTGEVDIKTWDKIVEVYRKILVIISEEDLIQIYPSPVTYIQPGERSIHLYAIQSIIHSITIIFNNLNPISITGINDADTVKTVKQLQYASGLPQTGVIDKPTWDNIAGIYTAYVSRNRVDNII